VPLLISKLKEFFKIRLFLKRTEYFENLRLKFLFEFEITEKIIR
jgi:hypothetical protein